MKITPAVTKSINETKYLSVDNHSRYRLIMRLFYINYMRLNYWLNASDVFEEIKEHINEYTIDDCKNDLDSLVEWGNLINDHDTEHISTIQDFKNKKFRYQMSEYSVEIERLTCTLENMNIEGASLDIGLIGSIRTQLEHLGDIEQENNETLYSWWKNLNENFKRLNREYQDYMKCFSFLKNEDNSNARQFILRKDDIIKYLRSFVKGLQKNGSAVAEILEEYSPQKNPLLRRIADYEYSIPRINGSNISKADTEENIFALYNNMYLWFAGNENSEMERIMNITNGVIKNLTNYAAIIAENINSTANRKEEYKLFAQMFMECEKTEDAHKLSSLLFGLVNTCHIVSDTERSTESISSGIYDEPPIEIITRPHITTYREKQKQYAIEYKTEEKQKLLNEHIISVNEQRRRIDDLIINGKIIMENIPKTDRQTRMILLNWISRAYEKNNTYKTEYGYEFKLIKPENNRKFLLRCDDGNLIMPAFILDFEVNT